MDTNETFVNSEISEYNKAALEKAYEFIEYQYINLIDSEFHKYVAKRAVQIALTTKE